MKALHARLVHLIEFSLAALSWVRFCSNDCWTWQSLKCVLPGKRRQSYGELGIEAVFQVDRQNPVL